MDNSFRLQSLSAYLKRNLEVLISLQKTPVRGLPARSIRCLLYHLFVTVCSRRYLPQRRILTLTCSLPVEVSDNVSGTSAVRRLLGNR